MIKNIHIKNFKSVQDLELPLGRFNVLIGENGSGKSNILEAMAFAGADSANKLDYEFLRSRGIRPSLDAKMMKSGFQESNLNEPISIDIKVDKREDPYSFKIEIEDKSFPEWFDLIKRTNEQQYIESILKIFKDDPQNIKEFETWEEEEKKLAFSLSQVVKNLSDSDKKDADKLIKPLAAQLINELINDNFLEENLSRFILYSPENSYLRQIDAESQILPLGYKGEGLFNLVQNFSVESSKESIDELKKFLHVIDWFEDFEIYKEVHSGKKYIQVKDRYLKEKLILNQGNVNEGFLFLLFYISLFISKDTPSFFAIDNLESSFHPRLCIELTKRLVELSKKHNKQVIITTHNPYILDGLDLNDQDQKLFVIRRDPDGETIADHIKEPLKDLTLSRGWMSGAIGGQPQTIE